MTAHLTGFLEPLLFAPAFAAVLWSIHKHRRNT